MRFCTLKKVRESFENKIIFSNIFYCSQVINIIILEKVESHNFSPISANKVKLKWKRFHFVSEMILTQFFLSFYQIFKTKFLNFLSFLNKIFFAVFLIRFSVSKMGMMTEFYPCSGRCKEIIKNQ